jgi:hypothetical protein
MSRRTAHAHSHVSREEERCIDFDAALADYVADGDAEGLLCAATAVIGSFVAIEPLRSDTIAELTGCGWEIKDYDDAGRAIRRWFAQMREPGARH